ncbi:MAG: TolC family protein [Pseudomonadota bacterium]
MRLNSIHLPSARSFGFLGLLVSSTALLSGCISMAPDAETPALVAQMPESFEAAPESKAGNYAPANWWAAFEDPVLDQLVSKALSSNLDIAESAARLRQVSAQARLARSALAPSINASGSASSTSTPVDGLAFGNLGGGTIDRIDNEAYNLDLGASYELDLFGRNRDDFRAARQDAIASAQDLRTVQLSTAAETISAYFDYVDAARQITLTEQTLDALRDRAERTDDRFERGLADSLELYQIRQDLRSTESSLPQLRSSLTATQSRLALLLGAYPGELDPWLDQPLRPRLVFEPVPTGLPADLLSQRPDIAAAYERMEAARLRIGARRAERFPTISLSASLGTQGGDPGSAFDFVNNWASSLASSIVAPILDAGRINANIASARATYDQQAAAYARSVVGAFGEVESALADYEQQRERYILTAAQLVEARGSLDLQSRRFEAGVGNYLSYLDALRTVYAVETSLSSAARSTALARLGVHRALGGDWASDVAPKDPEMMPDPNQGEAS